MSRLLLVAIMVSLFVSGLVSGHVWAATRFQEKLRQLESRQDNAYASQSQRWRLEMDALMRDLANGQDWCAGELRC